jgi:hypothetical protein
MTLLIACLLIHGFHFGWGWYLIACAGWLLHARWHPDSEQFAKIDSKLRSMRSDLIRAQCRYQGCKETPKK